MIKFHPISIDFTYHVFFFVHFPDILPSCPTGQKVFFNDLRRFELALPYFQGVKVRTIKLSVDPAFVHLTFIR